MDFLPTSIVTCPLLQTESATFQFPSLLDASGLNLPLLPIRTDQVPTQSPMVSLEQNSAPRVAGLIRHLVRFNMRIASSCSKRLKIEFPLEAKEWFDLFQKESRGRSAPPFNGSTRRSWLREGFVEFNDPRELIPLLGEDWFISHFNHTVGYVEGPVRVSLILRYVTDFQRYNEVGRRLLIIPGSDVTSCATFFTLTCD